MFQNWLKALNILLISIAALLVVLLIYLSCSLSTKVEKIDVATRKKPLPKPSFLQTEEMYAFAEKPFLSLSFNPVSLQLPDLRTKLVYFGKNARPDASDEENIVHIGFQGVTEQKGVEPGKAVYLCYDPSKKNGGYSFSPDNRETSLWIVAEPSQKGVNIAVRMKDERGVVATPESHAQFELPEKERPRFGGQPWQMGKWRADGSLFARQRARWYGKDQFLEEFGGDEYAHIQKKQRIDFAAEGEEPYSIYVGCGDLFVWEENRWKAVKEGVTSVGKPLLVVNKVEDRIMNCDLWDPEGKQKTRLNLLRSMESWIPQNLERHFRFVGAHTRSQYAFEVNKQRMILSQDDWLLHTPQGWIKLETSEQIDQYVNRLLSGTLFIFEGIASNGAEQVIEGRMFNSSRTESKEVKIPLENMARGGVSSAVATSHAVVAKEDDEDDDEDDEFPDPYLEFDEFMLD